MVCSCIDLRQAVVSGWRSSPFKDVPEARTYMGMIMPIILDAQPLEPAAQPLEPAAEDAATARRSESSGSFETLPSDTVVKEPLAAAARPAVISINGSQNTKTPDADYALNKLQTHCNDITAGASGMAYGKGVGLPPRYPTHARRDAAPLGALRVRKALGYSGRRPSQQAVAEQARAHAALCKMYGRCLTNGCTFCG